MSILTLNRQDAAEMLGISVSSLDRLCKHGKIAFVSVTDRRRVFRLEDIEAYLAQEVVPPKN